MVLLNALYLIIDLPTQEEEMSERRRLSAGRIIWEKPVGHADLDSRMRMLYPSVRL